MFHLIALLHFNHDRGNSLGVNYFGEVTKKSVKPNPLFCQLRYDLVSTSEQNDTKYLTAQSLEIVVLECLPSNERYHLRLRSSVDLAIYNLPSFKW
jgi:hypothetical protein